MIKNFLKVPLQYQSAPKYCFSTIKSTQSSAKHFHSVKSDVFERPTQNLDDPNSHEHYMALEHDHCTHNLRPLPVVMKEGKGAWLTDVKGNKYIDFLGSYGSANHGHCNPKIREAVISQLERITILGGGCHHDQLGPAMKYITETLGFDKGQLQNGGVEANETALLYARKWAYLVKGIPQNQAEILFPTNNYWGKSISARSVTDEFQRYNNFGPYGSLKMNLVPYNDIKALEEAFESNPNIAAYLMEPIQGYGGINVPSKGYLQQVRQLCTKYNVLLILDEIQTGLGRTGKLLCSSWDNVKPDMVTLGKSLSGGHLPVSGVFGKSEVMDVVVPGDNDSTYGANPVACAVAKRAIEVLYEDDLIDNSLTLGETFYKELNSMNLNIVKEVRGGRGLYAGVQLADDADPWKVCLKFLENGLIAKSTIRNTIRLIPPLVITESELQHGLDIIKKSLSSF